VKGRAGLLIGLLALLALVASTFAVVAWNQARASRAEASSCYLGFPNTETTPEIQLSGSGALDVCNDLSNPIRNSGPLRGSSVVVGHARTPYQICHYAEYGMTWTIWDVKAKVLSTPNPDFPPEAPPGGGLCPRTTNARAAATPAPTPIPIPTMPPGLLATGTTFADFLQVIQSGSTVSGTETYYEYDATSSTHVSQGSAAVSGFVQGRSVQLTIGSGIFTGSIESDGSLDLSVPQSNGAIAVERYVASSIEQYNAALAPIQVLVSQWDNGYWATQARRSCILADGDHDVRVFIGSGGEGVCSAALNLGYQQVTTYLKSDSVICVGSVNGATVAVSDDGGEVYGRQICQDVDGGAFPSVSAPPP
jgi:hypothetical protein